MSAVIVLQQMLVLFSMIAIGVFLWKKNWIDVKGQKALSKMVVNIFNPQMCIRDSLYTPPVTPWESGMPEAGDLTPGKHEPRDSRAKLWCIPVSYTHLDVYKRQPQGIL